MSLDYSDKINVEIEISEDGDQTTKYLLGVDETKSKAGLLDVTELFTKDLDLGEDNKLVAYSTITDYVSKKGGSGLTTGDAGATGDSGERGDAALGKLQGVQGLQGTVAGPQGDKGPDGQSGQGFQGHQGLQGVKGAQGVQGPNGRSRTDLQQSDQYRGPQGIQGPKGDDIPGPPGDQGPAGVKGIDGTVGDPEGTITWEMVKEFFQELYGIELAGNGVARINPSSPSKVYGRKFNGTVRIPNIQVGEAQKSYKVPGHLESEVRHRYIKKTIGS